MHEITPERVGQWFKTNSISVDIKASTWLSYFEQLLHKDNQRPLSELDVNLFRVEDNVDQMCPFTNENVGKSIFKLKLNKSQGKDGIGAEFYRHTCHNISPILTILFNKMLSSCEFPDSWSKYYCPFT